MCSGLRSFLLNLLGFLDLLTIQGFHPMMLKEMPQAGPYRGLVVHVDPLLDEAVQPILVKVCKCDAETSLIVGHFAFHPFRRACACVAFMLRLSVLNIYKCLSLQRHFYVAHTRD